MAAVKLGALAFAGAALAVPYHGHNHAHLHHNKRHGPSSYGSSAGAPFPIANGTQPAYAPTGSLVTYTSTSTNYKTVTSTVEYGTGYGSGASLGAADYSATSCAEDVTVTTKIYETVTVTPGTSSSAVAPVETSSEAATSSVASSSSAAIVITSSSSVSSSSSASDSEVSAAAAPSVSLTYSEVAKGHSWAPASSSSQAASTSSSSSSSTTEEAAPTTTSLAAYVASSTSSSSASSSSSSTSAPGKGKRGVAYNDANLTECFKGDDSFIGWAYNWNADSWGLDGIGFVPTLHDNSDSRRQTWVQSANNATSGSQKTVFSFNEPDIVGQANLSPEDAAQAHIDAMKDVREDAFICAPSISNSGALGQGADWLARFFKACDGNCRIDCLNLHYYAWDKSSDFASYVDRIHNNATFGGLPIYVSEIGVTSGSVDLFLQKAMPFMDYSEYVLGYAYFMVSEGLLVEGTEPSSYGTTYRHWTNDTVVDYWSD